jgi:hypothetical protein
MFATSSSFDQRICSTKSAVAGVRSVKSIYPVMLALMDVGASVARAALPDNQRVRP